MFDYSDEDGTEAAGLPGKVSAADRSSGGTTGSARWPTSCASQRAEERLGRTVEVLVDTVADGVVEGRAAHQAPEVDGSTTLVAPVGGGVDLAALRPGDLVRATVDRHRGRGPGGRAG